MLTLVLAVTLLSHQMLQTTVDRLDATSASFCVEARWIADGATRQYLERSKNSGLSLDDLLKPASWTFAQTPKAPPITIVVQPSSAQDKLHLPSTPAKDWIDFWHQKNPGIELAQAPDQRLLESADAALEVVLAPQYVTAQDAYLWAGGSFGSSPVPAEYITVWGNGRVDLNHASLDVLQARFPTFTNMQVSGLLRARGQGRITSLAPLTEQLSLSEDQRKSLAAWATTHCTCVELVIQIRKGGLSSLFHAAFIPGQEGRVLEVRPIL
jgi:hypothetical protein